ncbi:hypothetical protein AKO1_009450 [Acrasis kona]|uniref:Uncharacterized protein n=1 Tax=Acrasis kona TaxID=1008807 RepID=A0AAW2ZKH4_9EUKA
MGNKPRKEKPSFEHPDQQNRVPIDHEVRINVERDDGSITFKVQQDTECNLISNRYELSYDSIPPQGKVKYTLVNGTKLPTSTPFFTGNSFVMSAFSCYSNHHHLIIKPDDVWIAITVQLSNYVNANGEELRNKFVDFKGKKELVVKTQGTLYTANYEDLCRCMKVQIEDNIKDPSIAEWVVPNFSTTDDTDRVVGCVVLMSTLKSYFDYKIEMSCNLPSVTLLGEVEDWVLLREKANRLLEFDQNGILQHWSTLLFPVLDEFIRSARGEPNVYWWNRIANMQGGGSGPSYLSGWITTFCVFDEDGKYRGKENEVTDWSSTKYFSDWCIVNFGDIQRGYVNVPVLIDDNGVEIKTELFAGHLYTKIGDDSKSLRPMTGWALFKEDEVQ